MNLEFFIPGIPAPGGSKRAFVLKRKDGSFVRRANGSPIVNIVDDAGQRNKDWRASVAHFAQMAMNGQPPTGEPLEVSITFYRTRPKGHFGKHGLKEAAPAFPLPKPDATKLMRSTEDAMTGIVWIDDAQIVNQHVYKRFSDKPGAQVRVKLADDASNPRVEIEMRAESQLFSSHGGANHGN